jgi:hypothetical protein
MLWYNYLYENKMFTNKQDAALLGKENAWEVRGGVGKESSANESLIYARWKESRLRQGCQIELKMPADMWGRIVDYLEQCFSTGVPWVSFGCAAKYFPLWL